MDGIAESSFAELIDDPMVGLLMKSDGVDRRSVELLFQWVARARAQGIEPSRPPLREKEAARCTMR